MNARRVMIVAGEASGDLHGGNLVRAMLRIDPGLSFCGIGGDRMKAAGVELMADAADMAVVGLTEVVSKLRGILRVMRRLKALLKEEPPDLVILIDYPDFNLPMARAAKKRGIPVLYYISPQIWAWRKGRIRTIRKCVDRMVVILPFEEKFYRAAGMDAAYVGHPLLDVVETRYDRREALKRFGLRDETITVAVLPGSRRGEVEALLPEMLGACGILAEKISRIQFILPMAATLDPDFVHEIIRRFPVEVRVIRDEIYDVVAVSDAAMVASGTATLETALLGTPMAVVYKVSPLTYAIGRMCIRVDHISLVNLIAGRAVVPELIQAEANPKRIASEIGLIVTRPDKAREVKAALSEIRGKLGTPGASERTARIACDMLVNYGDTSLNSPN